MAWKTSPHPKGKIVSCRLTDEELAEVEMAMKDAGMSKDNYLRAKLGFPVVPEK